MSTTGTQFNSSAATRGQSTSGRTYAKQFTGGSVVAAGLCLSSRPAICLPGGALMPEGAHSLGNLWISDRRSNLI